MDYGSLSAPELRLLAKMLNQLADLCDQQGAELAKLKQDALKSE